MNEIERKKILEEKISSFDPNGIGFLNRGIFGLPFKPEESKIVLIPVLFQHFQWRPVSTLTPTTTKPLLAFHNHPFSEKPIRLP